MIKRLMRNKRKTSAQALVLWIAIIALAGTPQAIGQAYPTKSIRLIVPFPAGGGSDAVGRIIGQSLGERLGQQVVVDNRAGAGGSIGTEAAVKSAPDGYTMVLASTSEIAINPTLYSKLNYDTVRDLAPVAMVGSTPIVIVVHPSLPVKFVKDLVELGKAQPGAINVASAGTGTTTHLAGELFRSLVNVTWTHIPYKGAPPALTDLVSGQVQVMFSSLPGAMPLIRANRIRPIAVSTKTRAESIPNVPTVIESGVPGYDVEYWFGMFVPAATGKDIVARLHEVVVQSLKQSIVINNLANQGATPGRLSLPDFSEFVKLEVAKWGQVVRASGTKAD